MVSATKKNPPLENSDTNKLPVESSTTKKSSSREFSYKKSPVESSATISRPNSSATYIVENSATNKSLFSYIQASHLVEFSYKQVTQQKKVQ